MISGTPSMTASRPITTDEITMITPTERSMPAVRMTSVCAMPRMPMIVTWVSTVERLLPVTKWRVIDADAEQQAEHQHDERERSWDRDAGSAGRASMTESCSSSKEACAVAAAVSTRSNSCGCGRPSLRGFGHLTLLPASPVSRHGLVCKNGARKVELASAGSFYDIKRSIMWEINPSRASRLLRRDRGHAGDRMVGDQLLAGVSMPGCFPASCRS